MCEAVPGLVSQGSPRNQDSHQHWIHTLSSDSPHDVDSHELVPKIYCLERDFSPIRRRRRRVSRQSQSLSGGTAEEDNKTIAGSPSRRCLTCPEQVRNNHTHHSISRHFHPFLNIIVRNHQCPRCSQSPSSSKYHKSHTPIRSPTPVAPFTIHPPMSSIAVPHHHHQ